jgi:hypothetical protein
MPAAKKHKLIKLHAIVRKLSFGLSVEQACARVGVSHDWFYLHTKPGSEHEQLRAKAEAAMIEGRLRIIRKCEREAPDWKTRLAAATWQLERIQRRQYGQDDRNIYIGAQQINYAPSEEKRREIDAQYQASLQRLKARETNGSENGS